MDSVTEALIESARVHVAVETPEGWIDCECGWQSNHPLTEDGEPDPIHTGLDQAFTEHRASEQAKIVVGGGN